jgi:hypothetical protein
MKKPNSNPNAITLKRVGLLLIAFCLVCNNATVADADYVYLTSVYLTSIDVSNGHFARYDVSSDTWDRLKI